VPLAESTLSDRHLFFRIRGGTDEGKSASASDFLGQKRGRKGVRNLFCGFVKVAGYRDDIPRKPDPASVLFIAAEMNLPAEQIALVGDSTVDMETARNARMIPIGVSWGFRGPAELDQAIRIIDHPTELLDLVRS